MPGDDQERFEDYLELEHFIAELQAGHMAHPPQELTPTQARVYHMATLFHAATPGVSEPDPMFAAQLQSRLENELQDMQKERRPAHTQATAQPSSARPRRIPRRLLLAGSATVAASLAIGAGMEHMADQALQNRGSQDVTIKVTSPTNWFIVTTVARLGNQAVKFKTENPDGSISLTGYIVRSDGASGDPSEKGRIIAMSAACTHKGCIVQWSDSDRKFHCPCHGGVFTEDGGIDFGMSALTYLNSLPRLDVNVDRDGQISVRMPASD